MNEFESKQKVIANANDALRMHNCANAFHSYQLGMTITSGAKALADEFQCYWFLDVVCSYQPQLQSESFQVWVLKRYEETHACIVTCTDGNDKLL